MRRRTRAISFWCGYGEVLALVVALIATLGSLYLSEIVGFVPCKLCWYQRILMYPITLIVLVGILKNEKHLPAYILPFSIIGIGVSTYHYLIQLGLYGQPAGCVVGIPCNVRYVNYFGFVTIPLLALIAFIAITVIALAVRWACDKSNELEAVDAA